MKDTFLHKAVSMLVSFMPATRTWCRQFIHEDDLAAALLVMIHHDLPGAYNVVGDGVDTQPHIAAEAGLQVIEVPDEIFLPQIAHLWQTGVLASGPEWSKGDVNIICSNQKLKATGLWTPRYNTTEAFAATVKALSSATS